MKLYQDKEWLYQKYWIEGLSLPQISRKYGIGVTTLWQWMKKLDVPIRLNSSKKYQNAKWKNKEILEKEYIKDKNSGSIVAKKYGISRYTLYRHLRKYDIPVRSNGEAAILLHHSGFTICNGKYSNKDWLYGKYITEKLSTIKIGKICGVSSSTIKRWLKKHKIKIRSVSEALKGGHLSEECRRNMSKRLKGHRGWNKGKTKYNDSAMAKMSETKTENYMSPGVGINLMRGLYYHLYYVKNRYPHEIANLLNIGVSGVRFTLFKKMLLEKRNINEIRKIKKVKVKCTYCGKELWRWPHQIKANKRNEFFCNQKCQGEWTKKSGYRSGSKASQWKNGKNALYKNIVRSEKYTEWRNKIYKRDWYTCQLCHEKCNPKNIIAHHIITIKTIVDNFKIENLEQALECDKLWDINNGITLCKKCHFLVHHSKWGKEWSYYALRSLTYKKTGLYRNEKIFNGCFTIGTCGDEKGYEYALVEKKLTEEERKEMLERRYPKTKPKQLVLI